MSGSQAFGRCGVGMEKRWCLQGQCGHSLDSQGGHSVPSLEPGGNSRATRPLLRCGRPCPGGKDRQTTVAAAGRPGLGWL